MLKQSYPVVHISSHFKFDPKGNRENSFLLLGDGNILTLDQILRGDKGDDYKQYQFRLDLLTLSACETAMGSSETNTGKEIEGFGVLAQQKGAKAVLATLWKVYDKSTAHFMQELYKIRTTQLVSKAKALQQAQKKFIQEEIVTNVTSLGEQKKDYSHPYHWAPFILMGNWL